MDVKQIYRLKHLLFSVSVLCEKIICMCVEEFEDAHACKSGKAIQRVYRGGRMFASFAEYF